MFHGEEDEEDFLSPTAGSKLASLFGMDRASSVGGNETLTYTAPKEPKKKPDTASENHQVAGAPSVMCAVAGYAYKYVDGEYVAQGKLGVAVIGNPKSNDYKILLYISKEKPVAFCKITSTSGFSVQPNNYASFYDDQRQNWSVMFESEANLTQFAKQFALAKACCQQPKVETLVTQDLILGEGPSVESGDSVELKYSSWILDENKLGPMSETNQLTRFRIGKGKALKAFEEGALGMKKNGQRLLIAPSAFCTDGKTAKSETGAAVIFEIELIRVKFGRDREDNTQQSSAPVPPTLEKEEVKDDNVKTRSKSISDQMSNQVKPDKAKLISRMAKMGQPMLPVSTGQQLDHSDREGSLSPVSRPEVPAKPSSQPAVSPSPYQTNQPAPMSYGQPVIRETISMMSQYGQPMSHVMNQQYPVGPSFQGPAVGQVSIYQPPAPPFQNMMPGFPQMPQVGPSPYNNMYQPYPAQPPPPTTTQSSTGDSNLPMMLMETRQQNTEVRVMLNRVSDKVDRISEKLDQVHSQQSTAVALSSSMPNMEVGMLVHNIEKIVMDNERLKKENMEKSSRIESQNGKISELLQRNQHYIEQSNAVMEQRNDSLKLTSSQAHDKVRSLEQEKVNLAMELSSTTSQLTSCQLEIVAMKKRESEKMQQLESLISADAQNREDVGSLRLQLSESERQLESLTTRAKSDEKLKKQLQSQLNELQEKLTELTMERDTLDRSLTEKKRTVQEDVARLELEIEQLQSAQKLELSTLKDRLKREMSSTEILANKQVSQVEEELNKDWKEKCDHLLESAHEKHQRELQDVLSEKQLLKEKVEYLEKRVSDLKSEQNAGLQKLDFLEEEAATLRVWKEKYDGLKSNATTMKERYEERIVELEEERDAAIEDKQTAVAEKEKLEKSRRTKSIQNSSISAAPADADVRATVVSEVKKIMNSVYRRIRTEFVAEDNYSGSEVYAIAMDVIKVVTLEMVEDKTEDEDVQSEASEDEQEEIETLSVEESNFVHSDQTSVIPTSENGHLSTSDQPPLSDERGSNDDDVVVRSSDPQVATIPESEDSVNEIAVEQVETNEKTGSSTDNIVDSNVFIGDNEELTEQRTEISQGDYDNSDSTSNEPRTSDQKEDVQGSNSGDHEKVKVTSDSDDESFTSITSNITSNDGEKMQVRDEITDDRGKLQVEDKISEDGAPPDADNSLDAIVTVSSEINSESRLSTPSPPLFTSEKRQESTEDTVPVDNKSMDGGDRDTNTDPENTQDEGFFSRDGNLNLKSEKSNDLVQENAVDNVSPTKKGNVKVTSDSDDEDLFGFSSAKPVETKKPEVKAEPKETKKVNSKPKRNESDEDLKSKPPPLFGDSGDENDDLDWLS